MVSMLQLGIFLTISICLVGSTKTINKTYYLFYAPKHFSIDEGLNITVILFGKVESTTKVTVTLKDGEKVVKTMSQDISVDDKIATLKMNTGDLEIKYYMLHLNLGGSLRVFCGYGAKTSIMTAKGIYSPGDTLEFRVLNLYQNLTARNSPATVYIKNANGNLVSKMQLPSPVNGVSTGKFPISSRPVLGMWTIEVNQDQLTTKKTVEVDKYILPKLEVTAGVSKYQYRLNENNLKGVILNVTVKAQYTQGKPVKGTAKLFINEVCLTKKSFSQKILKETTFQIDLGKYASTSCYNFNINASVVNDLDGREYYADMVTTSLTNFPVNIINHYNENTYQPNVLSKFKVTVKRVDEQPLTDEDRKYPLEISVNIDDFSFSKSSKIPENGIVEFEFVPANRSHMSVKVIFKGEYQSKKYQMERQVILSQPEGWEKLSLTRIDDETSKPEFLLTFPVPVTSFFFTVVSCSKVVFSKHVQQTASKRATVSFDSSGMFPKAYIVAGYSDGLGEIMIASGSVDVKRPIIVPLEASFKTSPVKPSQKTELVFKGNPDTTVFVTSVDKSVLLLAKKTNLDIETILREREGNDKLSFPSSNEIKELHNIGIASYTNLNSFWPIIFEDGFVRKEFPLARPESAGEPAPKPRTNFVETWIWDSITIGSTGTASLVKNAPDTITTWVTTLFGMHPSEGFISHKGEVTLTTFQDFYISLGIPYSIVRGELFILNVYVFNYIAKNETVTVELRNPDNTVKDKKTVKMTADETEVAVAFTMEPKDIGKVPVSVYASMPGYADAVQRYVNVIAEGSTYEKSESLSVNVSSKEPFSESVEITYPPDVVKGSKFVSVTVIGDIMGPVLSGLEKFIRLPTGCGEQTMLSLYPNVLVYTYLNARAQLDGATKQKLEKNTNAGYQNELSYQHFDGSFSAFGKSDKSGSTWLTAYVIKCFCKAKLQMKGVTIDSQVIKKAMLWLLKQQQEDGSFKEVGNIIHTDMQSGTSSGVTLTAFVAISLLQCEDVDVVKVKDSLKKTAEYLRKWVDNKKAKDDYSRAVVLTAFALLKDDEYFNRVNKTPFSLATKTDKSSFSKMSNSKSVEIAAYVLLAYSYKNKIEESVPFYKFLVSQRNRNGGYHSTQDTVMGLEANTGYAMLFRPRKDTSVNVTIETEDGTKYSFTTITHENSIMLYKKDLPSDVTTVKVNAIGNGYALIQVNWQYNLIPDEQLNYLSIHMKRKLSLDTSAEYNACVKYTGEKPTGMALLSINPLSGYVANPVDRSVNPLIKKSEVEDNKLVVYMDSLPRHEELCIPVQMDLETKVEKLKPQLAEMSLYYQPDQKAETIYSIEDPITASSNMLQSVSLVIMLFSTALLKLLI